MAKNTPQRTPTPSSFLKMLKVPAYLFAKPASVLARPFNLWIKDKISFIKDAREFGLEQARNARRLAKETQRLANQGIKKTNIPAPIKYIGHLLKGFVNLIRTVLAIPFAVAATAIGSLSAVFGAPAYLARRAYLSFQVDLLEGNIPHTKMNTLSGYLLKAASFLAWPARKLQHLQERGLFGRRTFAGKHVNFLVKTPADPAAREPMQDMYEQGSPLTRYLARTALNALLNIGSLIVIPLAVPTLILYLLAKITKWFGGCCSKPSGLGASANAIQVAEAAPELEAEPEPIALAQPMAQAQPMALVEQVEVAGNRSCFAVFKCRRTRNSEYELVQTNNYVLGEPVAAEPVAAQPVSAEPPRAMYI